MLPEVADDVQQKENTKNREERGQQHAGFHADLFGGKGKRLTEAGGQIAGGHLIDHDAHQLRGEGRAHISAGGHQRIGSDAGGGDLFLHHDQRTGPQHAGEKTGQDAGCKGDHDVHGETRDQIAGRRADHAAQQDGDNASAVLAVADPGQAQQDGEHSHAEDVAQRLVDVQRILHEAGNPVGHGVFRAASEENAAHAQQEADAAPALPGRFGAGDVHIGHGRGGEQVRRQRGQKGQNDRQIHPVMVPEDAQEERRDQHDGEHAEGIQ